MNFHPSMAGIETAVRPGKLIVDLLSDECRYCIGEDKEGRSLFCSSVTDETRSYCPAHMAIVYEYVPVVRRTKVSAYSAVLTPSREGMAREQAVRTPAQVPPASISPRSIIPGPAKALPEPTPKTRPFQHPVDLPPAPLWLPRGPSSFEECFERAAKEHPLKDDIETVKIRSIQNVCCKHFGITRTDMLSARRMHDLTWPRQIAMYLCKVLTLHSLIHIGRRFGDRDHTTVLHAVRKVERMLRDGDEALRQIVDELTAAVRASGGKAKTHEGAR